MPRPKDTNMMHEKDNNTVIDYYHK